MTHPFLVTGGFGFIGNEVVRQLMANAPVAILDNCNRVAPKIQDLESIPHFRADITDSAAVHKAIRTFQPATVIHLAAIHYIPECNDDPARTLRVNVEGTDSLIRACAAEGVRHVIFASSGAVYADSVNPLSESSTVAPVDIYGWSKLFGEQMCQFRAKSSGLRLSIARLFNNYGPRETNAHIVPEIIDQLRTGDSLQLGNVKPKRDYIHTMDCASALISLAFNPPETLCTVNIGTGCSTSVEELVGIIGRFLGRDIKVVSDPTRFRPVDKQEQVADISLIGNLTGWSPKISLEEGIESLLAFEGLLPC